MLNPFRGLFQSKPKSNVIQFPIVARPVPRRYEPQYGRPLTANRRQDEYVWANSQRMNWASYEDLLKDILIDIRMGRINPSGMLVALVDDNAGIEALACYTRGFNKQDIEDVCNDILDSND
jgi:hypothetical protein